MNISKKEMKKISSFREMYQKQLGEAIKKGTDMNVNRELFEVFQLLLLIEDRLEEFVDSDISAMKAVDSAIKELTK